MAWKIFTSMVAAIGAAVIALYFHAYGFFVTIVLGFLVATVCVIARYVKLTSNDSVPMNRAALTEPSTSELTNAAAVNMPFYHGIPTFGFISKGRNEKHL